MKRTTIFLDERVEGDLRAVSRRRNQPVAAIVREALERFVSAEVRGRGTTLRFLAVGRSGRRDTAERHEDLLWKRFEPQRTGPGRSRRAREKKT